MHANQLARPQGCEHPVSHLAGVLTQPPCKQGCSGPRPAFKCHPMKRTFTLWWQSRHPSRARHTRLAANRIRFVVNLKFPSTTGLENTTKGLENPRTWCSTTLQLASLAECIVNSNEAQVPHHTGGGLRGLAMGEPSTGSVSGSWVVPAHRHPSLGGAGASFHNAHREQASGSLQGVQQGTSSLTGKLNSSAIPLGSKMPIYKR